MARVLVVEPDRQIRQFIAGILADFGHQVRQCRDVGDARCELRRAWFDLVATDLALDRHSGVATALPRRPRVVALCGRPLRAGGDKYARARQLREKPFRFADLRSLVAAAETCETAFALAV